MAAIPTNGLFANGLNNALSQIGASERELRQMQQPYRGVGVFSEKRDGKEYIRVDKGSPDKASYVIFYAEAKPEEKPKDPMIFVNTKAEVKKEIEKLSKRTDVDVTSIRIFSLEAVARVEIDFSVKAKNGGKTK